jgi:hypothetical protein
VEAERAAQGTQYSVVIDSVTSMHVLEYCKHSELGTVIKTQKLVIGGYI